MMFTKVRSIAVMVALFSSLLAVPTSIAAADDAGSWASPSALTATASAQTSISAGGSFSCSLLNNGNVKCWGSNGKGQLGDGTTTSRSTPVPVDFGTDVTAVQVSAGGSHSCAILNNGSVKCWGWNIQGQVGDGTTDDRSTPTTVDLGTDMTAVQIASGSYHSCAVLNDGSVKCWGWNINGQLGDGSTTSSLTPVAVDLGANSTAAQIMTSPGALYSCAVLNDGSVKCWGANNYGQLGDGTTTDRPTPVPVDLGTNFTAAQVSGGTGHLCAVLNNGSVKCWGNNVNGQLGDGTNDSRLTPVPIDLGTNMTAALISTSGAHHSCAVLNDGSVKCWGGNYYGQLGDGTNDSRLTPVPVDLGTNMSAAQVTTGGDHSCAVLNDGSARCWGLNYFKQLGDGTAIDRSSPVPVDLGLTTTAVQISAGGEFSCAVLSDGTAKCWGRNEYGQIGDGVTPASGVTMPVTVDLGTNVTAVQISAGLVHSCALLNDGSVKCWGRNAYGQVGDGTTIDQPTPVAVDLGSNMTAVQISAGGDFSCAVLNDGSVKCWGRDNYGQLGDGGTNTDSLTPVTVDLGTNLTATEISSGTTFSCAVLNDGSVKCWGQNHTGQLGDGTTTNRSTPVPVDLGTNMTAVQITAGGFNSCAVLNDGSARCWGSDYYGQLGDGGADTNSSTPVTVVLGTNLTALQMAAGKGHLCAALNNGSAKCWGWNNRGQVGDGTTTNRSTPVTVDLGTNMTASQLSGGDAHSCVILSNGSAKCWGRGAYGRLGNDADASGDQSTPALVLFGPVVADAPTSAAGVAGNGQVGLSWVAPSSDGGAAVTDYLVEYQPDGGSWATFADGVSTSTATTVTSLSNGTLYAFRISAINSAGTSAASITAVATPAATTPGTPMGVAGTAGDTQVALSWTAPSSDGGAAVTDYLVEYQASGGSRATFVDGVSASTSATVTGLINDVAYAFRISAINSAGASTASTTASATPAIAGPALGGCPSGSTPFTDVEGSFAEADIACLYALEITTGTGAASYSPDALATREQMAAFLGRLWRSMGQTCPVAATPFTDIEGSSAESDIGCINALGITTGTSPTSYSPKATVTREEMAAFLARTWRALGRTFSPPANPFTDIEGSFAESDIGDIYSIGITNGTGRTSYSPKAAVTREQMAAFLARFIRAATA